MWKKMMRKIVHFPLFRFDELGIEKKIGKSMKEERISIRMENPMKVWMIDSVFFFSYSYFFIFFLWMGFPSFFIELVEVGNR